MPIPPFTLLGQCILHLSYQETSIFLTFELNFSTAINGYSGAFPSAQCINMCAIHQKDVKPDNLITSVSCSVNIKDPTVSFTKAKQVIASTLAKLKIPGPSNEHQAWSCDL